MLGAYPKVIGVNKLRDAGDIFPNLLSTGLKAFDNLIKGKPVWWQR